jgi:hypothetical protein
MREPTSTQAGLLRDPFRRVTNEAAMHLPREKSLLLSLFALALSLSVGCAKVSVTPANQSYAAREAGCPVTWEHASFAQVSSTYEWIGELTLRNERGVILTESDRQLLEAQACRLGGDALVRTTGVRQKGAGLASFSDLRFGVLRRRTAPSANGTDGEPAPELPAHGAGGETIAHGGHHRPVQSVR